MTYVVAISFTHFDDTTEYHAQAEVRVSGEDLRCIDLFAESWHGTEPSEHIYKVLEQKAEQIVWEQINGAANKRYGCECIPLAHSTTIAPNEHQPDCPITIQQNAREAYREQTHEDRRHDG